MSDWLQIIITRDTLEEINSYEYFDGAKATASFKIIQCFNWAPDELKLVANP